MDFRYNKEELKFKQPEDKIMCRNCRYAQKDYVVNGQVLIYGYKAGICDQYPHHKPADILFKSGNCTKFKAKEV